MATVQPGLTLMPMMATDPQWWQVLSPIVAIISVLAAVGIAGWGSWERQRDNRQAREDEQHTREADARLVLVAGRFERGTQNESALITHVENCSPFAIIDFRIRIWQWSDPNAPEGEPVWWSSRGFIRQGDRVGIVSPGSVKVSQASRRYRWRIEWADRWGTAWSRSGYSWADKAVLIHGEPERNAPPDGWRGDANWLDDDGTYLPGQ